MAKQQPQAADKRAAGQTGEQAGAEDPFDFAPGWRPEPGDTVIGKVEGLDRAENKWGAYPVVTLVTDDGERIAVHGFHTVLRNALRRARPMPGSRIAVRYVGLVSEDKSGKALVQDYHGYQVRMLDQDAGTFWGSDVQDDDMWQTGPKDSNQFNDEPPF
jgi:hypothetical protein